MPDPSVKHEEEGIESQLIAHGSSRVVALQERVASGSRARLVLGTARACAPPATSRSRPGRSCTARASGRGSGARARAKTPVCSQRAAGLSLGARTDLLSVRDRQAPTPPLASLSLPEVHVLRSPPLGLVPHLPRAARAPRLAAVVVHAQQRGQLGAPFGGSSARRARAVARARRAPPQWKPMKKPCRRIPAAPGEAAAVAAGALPAAREVDGLLEPRDEALSRRERVRRGVAAAALGSDAADMAGRLAAAARGLSRIVEKACGLAPWRVESGTTIAPPRARAGEPREPVRRARARRCSRAARSRSSRRAARRTRGTRGSRGRSARPRPAARACGSRPPRGTAARSRAPRPPGPRVDGSRRAA